MPREVAGPPMEPRHQGAYNEDDIPSCSAIARVITRDANYGSGAKPQKCEKPQNCDSNPSLQDRGPRSPGSALERRLHDRPRPQPVRRADVDLWKHRRIRTIQRRILTYSPFGTITRDKEDMNQNRVRFAPEAPFENPSSPRPRPFHHVALAVIRVHSLIPYLV
jgi:hypothetical protein